MPVGDRQRPRGEEEPERIRHSEPGETQDALVHGENRHFGRRHRPAGGVGDQRRHADRFARPVIRRIGMQFNQKAGVRSTTLSWQ